MVHITQITKSVQGKDIKRDWHLVDVSDMVLGRVSTRIARVLSGKEKVNYVPYLDNGDYVVVINAKKVLVTGKKFREKIYTRFSGYPGGLKEISYKEMYEKNPEEIIRQSVLGMLPKNKLRKDRIKRLYIFPDETHRFQKKQFIT